MSDGSPFSNLQQLLARHFNPSAIRLREDLVFEVPPIGFFKLVEAKGGVERAQNLYYARHPEDFDPAIPIKDNKRINPVDMEEMPLLGDVRWDPTNPNRQHNVSWVYPVLTALLNKLPPALLEEANLHRLDDDNFVSGYVRYRVTKDKTVQDGRHILVSTNSTKRFLPVSDKHHPKEANGERKIRESFRECGRHLLSCALPLIPYALKVVDVEDPSTGKPFSPKERKPREIVDMHEVIPLLKNNFVYLDGKILSGDGPINRKDNRLLPIKHLSEKQQLRVKTMLHEYAKNKRSLLMDIGSVAFGVLTEGPIKTAISLASDTAIDEVTKAFSPQRYSIFVPKKWHALLRKDKIDTKTNDLLLRVNEDKFYKTEPFTKLEWISADGNTFNIPTQPAPLNPAAESGFQTWLLSQFFAPQGALFEYIGEGGVLVNPRDANKIKAIRCNAPNGLQMYYVPETQELYAYYHRPKIEVCAANEDRTELHRMPTGSPQIFRHNSVLKIDLAKGLDAPMTTVMFHQFAQKMHITLGTATLGHGNEYGEKERLVNFLRPHQYSPEVYCTDETYRRFHSKDETLDPEKAAENKCSLDFGPCAGGGNSMNPRAYNLAQFKS